MLSSEFSNKEISEQVQNVEKVLSNLQSITMVSNFDQIYNCLVEQLRQKLRLTELKQKNLEKHDTLLNKLNHAQTMRHLMENTMIETTNKLERYSYKTMHCFKFKFAVTWTQKN